jgi:CRP-like cAMP-binding protein
VIISDGEIIEEVLARTFPALTEGQLVRVTRNVERRHLEPGDILIHEGAAPEGFYIVAEGVVEVNLRAANGEEMVVAQMRAGQFVGEVELLHGAPKGNLATVRSSLSEPAEVVVLDRQEFADLVAESEPTRQALAEIARARLKENITARQS